MTIDHSLPDDRSAATDEPSTELDVELRVARRDDHRAYVATMADREIATVQYEHSDGRLVILTTTVLPAYRGRGISEELIAYALDDIRERGERITVLCPVVRAYLGQHPEYLDLLDAERPDF